MNLPGDQFFFHAATAEGEGGIAVVEIYGEGSDRAIEMLFVPAGRRLPREGAVRLGMFRDARGTAIDEVIVAQVPAASSWCGLASWIVSCHGGALVQRRLCGALSFLGGVELDASGVIDLARRRGHLDWIRGEALLLLREARTERGARYLLRMADGDLARRVGIVLGILDRGDLEGARAAIRDLLRAAPLAQRLLSPRRILIAGRPNSGKSSLFNRFVERERSAVTPVAGTTRDLLEELVAISGYPLIFIDSSGTRPLEESGDPVEREGMRRARAAATDALLFLIDRPGLPEPDEEEFMSLLPRERVLLVRTKSDLWAGGWGAPGGSQDVWISARTGAGLDDLREKIRSAWLGPPEGEEIPAAPFTERQVAAISRAAAATNVDEMHQTLVKFAGCSDPAAPEFLSES